MTRHSLLAAALTSRDAVLATNPFAYWRMGLRDIGGSIAYDEMGLNNGTYVGAPTLGVPGLLTGDPDTTAVTFSANTQAMQIASAPAQSGTGFTFVCWASRTGAWSGYPDLFDWNAESAAGCVEIGMDPSGLLTYGFSDGSFRYIRLNVPVAHDVPACLAVAHDFAAKTAAFYVNGVPIATSDLSSFGAPVPVPAGKALRVGNYAIGSESDWLGTVQEVPIWSRAVSAAELAGLYAVGMGR